VLTFRGHFVLFLPLGSVSFTGGRVDRPPFNTFRHDAQTIGDLVHLLFHHAPHLPRISRLLLFFFFTSPCSPFDGPLFFKIRPWRIPGPRFFLILLCTGFGLVTHVSKLRFPPTPPFPQTKQNTPTHTKFPSCTALSLFWNHVWFRFFGSGRLILHGIP